LKFTKTFPLSYIQKVSRTSDDIFDRVIYSFPKRFQFTTIEAMECRWCEKIVYAVAADYASDGAYQLETKQVCHCALIRIRFKALKQETRRILKLCQRI